MLSNFVWVNCIFGNQHLPGARPSPIVKAQPLANAGIERLLVIISSSN